MHTYTLSSCYSAKLFWGVLKSKAHPQQHCDMLKKFDSKQKFPASAAVIFIFYRSKYLFTDKRRKKQLFMDGLYFF